MNMNLSPSISSTPEEAREHVRRINETRNQERVDARRWETIEQTLRSDLPYELMAKYLRRCGATLADFAPIGYNDSQVARDSDG